MNDMILKAGPHMFNARFEAAPKTLGKKVLWRRAREILFAAAGG